MSLTAPSNPSAADLQVRPLAADDVERADAVMRDAFGSFLGLPEPATFMGDASYVRLRQRLESAVGFVAERDGGIVGSNFATRWGAFGFFGPLSVQPALWDTGIGQRLMEPVLEAFGEWGVAHAGLFTWPDSPKHLGLYQRYGFWPHALTLVMARPVDPSAAERSADLLGSAGGGREELLGRCREVADAVHEGLDLTAEAVGTIDAGAGDVVLVDGGFAVCQHGAGTEAGSAALYVKFGAVQPGRGAERRFADLLSACEAYAAIRRAGAVVLGVSTARIEAYRALLEAGFRIELQGLGMHRDGEPLWSRPGCWVLDDWR